MKLHFENTFPYQIDLLPRFTIRYDAGWLVMFEFLFWGIGFISDSWFNEINKDEV